MKIKCSKCESVAIWRYDPTDPRDRYYCDQCVSRGCSCNIDPNTRIEDTDNKGRLYPCCEYSWSEDGWDE